MNNVNSYTFSKIIDKNINNFMRNPFSFLSKFKPKNYSFEFVFKDFKNINMDKVFSISKKMTSMTMEELKKQIKEKKFNSKKFSKIFSIFMDPKYTLLIESTALLLMLIFFKTQIINAHKIFQFITFPFIFFNVFFILKIFVKELTYVDDFIKALTNIRKYKKYVENSDSTFTEIIHGLNLIIIFFVLTYFVFAKILFFHFSIEFKFILFFLFKILTIASLIFSSFQIRQIEKRQTAVRGDDIEMLKKLQPDFS